VQQAMVDCHGSQCGFCTPGFVMSLWALYVAHEAADTPADARRAAQRAYGQPVPLHGLPTDPRCGLQMLDLPKVPLDRDALVKQLQSIMRRESLAYEHQGRRFFAPRTLSDLLELRAAHPQATILAGNTDVGLWVTKQLRDLAEILYVGNVDELKVISESDG
jgi:xanthine dehydrogenase small subunit